MKKINLESSTLKSVSYDIKLRLLTVEFKKGSIYEYKCVDVIDVVSMLFAESSGSYFMKNIAKNYEYTKVSD